MAFVDDKGIVRYEEEDNLTPFQTVFNVAMQSVYDALDAYMPLAVKRLLSGVDLNDIIEPGVYMQMDNAYATGGSNYPVGLAGLLEVRAGGSFVYQRYTAYHPTNGRVYHRTRYNNVWPAWHELSEVGHVHAAGDVTSGTFGVNRIPDLPASKTTSGTFNADRIPNLPASKITSGDITRPVVNTSNLNEMGRVTLTNLPATANAPNIWASGSGLLYNTSFVPAAANHTHSEINSGSSLARLSTDATGPFFQSNVIYDRTYSALPNAHITAAGVIGRSTTAVAPANHTHDRIESGANGALIVGSDGSPRLYTSNAALVHGREYGSAAPGTGTRLACVTNAGTFGTLTGALSVDYIPNLPASKTTSGTFNADRIPSLPASKINSGTFDSMRIPSFEEANFLTLSAWNRTTGGLVNFDVQVGTNNTLVGRQLYRVTSSRKHKRDIKPAAVPIDSVLAIEPVTYIRNDDPDWARRELGLIAEDVAEHLPQVVVMDYDRWDDNGEPLGDPEPAAINYRGLTVALLAVVKEQAQQIKELTEKVDNVLRGQ